MFLLCDVLYLRRDDDDDERIVMGVVLGYTEYILRVRGEDNAAPAILFVEWWDSSVETEKNRNEKGSAAYSRSEKGVRRMCVVYIRESILPTSRVRVYR